MKVTKYQKVSPKVHRPYRLILLTDIHNKPFDRLVQQVAGEKPDAILVAGDIVDRHRKTWKRALPFLRACADVAPTFFSYGNHEVKFPIVRAEDIAETGAVLLDNSCIRFGDLVFGGQTPKADTSWLEGFEEQEGYRILLNHHPEYWVKWGLRERDIDLILAGHAHGGQWRFFDRGVLAPGQGLMAKYVRGEYGNMIVSTGCSNTAAPLVPRFFNPREIVVITVVPE
ncbi:MAG: metallophosphoesterase [Clostridia bacterium]|nr:metallophosphoesterase [Clostridia bacterium]